MTFDPPVGWSPRKWWCYIRGIFPRMPETFRFSKYNNLPRYVCIFIYIYVIQYVCCVCVCQYYPVSQLIHSRNRLFEQLLHHITCPLHQIFLATQNKPQVCIAALPDGEIKQIKEKFPIFQRWIGPWVVCLINGTLVSEVFVTSLLKQLRDNNEEYTRKCLSLFYNFLSKIHRGHWDTLNWSI